MLRLRPFLAIVTLACAACGEPPPPLPAAAFDATSPSILVAFREPHPLARAQALEAQGRHGEAEALARTALAADPALADLCLDHFTVGGAEIVLTPCAPLTPLARNAFARERAQSLAAMPQVVYAEPNLVAER